MRLASGAGGEPGGNVHLTVYDSATSFLEANGPFLYESEAENNLILGAVGALCAAASAADPAPYLAAVLRDDVPLLCAAAPRGRSLIFSAPKPGPVPAAASLVAEDLHRKVRRIPGLIAEEPLARHFVPAWTALAPCTAKLSMRQTLYVLRSPKAATLSPGRLRTAVERDRDLVAEWSCEFSQEALGRTDPAAARQYARSGIEAKDVFVWELEQPVSMAARARPTRHGVAVNHVYTPPAHRRRGYATSCVAELTRRLLDSGASFCTLYADVANRESNDIYVRIGYEPEAASAVFEFEYPGP